MFENMNRFAAWLSYLKYSWSVLKFIGHYYERPHAIKSDLGQNFFSNLELYVPGHNNITALTSSMILADDSMRKLNKLDRNCNFPEETSDLHIHKQYSYLNCKFECICYMHRQNSLKSMEQFVSPGFSLLQLTPFKSATLGNPMTSSGYF